MHDSVFREYDIRGLVGTEFILEEVFALGCAIAYYFLSKKKIKTVALCMDGRIDSPVIRDELARAFQSSGIDVTFIGLGPTPLLYFSLHTQPFDAGLMITASHNGKEYNGIKICLGTTALWGSEIQAIKQVYLQRKSFVAPLKGTYRIDILLTQYTKWLADHFNHLKGNDDHFIIDLAGAATCAVVPQLVEILHWKNATLINDTIDALFSAHSPDPCVIENLFEMKNHIIGSGQSQSPYSYGIAFDGDGDRMGAMNSRGALVSGDKLLGYFAQTILQNVPGGSVVFDAKCSPYLSEVIKKMGGRPLITPSGHSIIKHHMKKENALLGGELSCHFFFADRYFGFDDGIYAALRLKELIAKGFALDSIETLFPQTYSTNEIRIHCAKEDKVQAIESAKKFFVHLPGANVSYVDGVGVMTPYGWGLVRMANTQEMLSFRFESLSKDGLHRIMEDFRKAIGESNILF